MSFKIGKIIDVEGFKGLCIQGTEYMQSLDLVPLAKALGLKPNFIKQSKWILGDVLVISYKDKRGNRHRD